MLTTIVFEILLSFLGMIVVMFFSRHREYRADAGGAKLAGRDNMISALQALKRLYYPAPGDEKASLATLKIASGGRGGLMALLASHPPLDERIERLASGK